jgi:XTP/dITP diphosphohydrolase
VTIISLNNNGNITTALFFATGNMHKVEEVRLILKDHSLKVEHVDMKGVEIQSDNVEEVAKASAKWIAQTERIPVFVEDTGLFIDALKGFPGPYASYVHETIGIKGVLKLLESVVNRKAEFRSAVAFCSPKEESICFLGSISGKITFEERGRYGFGYDSIFEPIGSEKTFAELNIGEKNHYSHRAKAIKKFAYWYLEHSPF